MKIRTLLAAPFYLLWLSVYLIGLILAAIAAMIDGDIDIVASAYSKGREK